MLEGPARPEGSKQPGPVIRDMGTLFHGNTSMQNAMCSSLLVQCQRKPLFQCVCACNLPTKVSGEGEGCGGKVVEG